MFCTWTRNPDGTLTVAVPPYLPWRLTTPTAVHRVARWARSEGLTQLADALNAEAKRMDGVL